MTSLTLDLVELIRSKPVDYSDRETACLFVLDALANTMAGRQTEPGKKLLQWYRSQGRDAGRRAFVLGGLTHILETDDLHRDSVTHPGCVVVPMVFALAQDMQLQGRDLLDAVLQGYEAMCRVGNAVGSRHYEVWHNTATCGPFGSAMAAAHLFELNDQQAMHALGNAGTQSSGLWQFIETGAMSKHLHAGRAAESGLLAAQLAQQDFSGPPQILEGKKGFFIAACPDAEPDQVLHNPATQWQLLRTSIKPWPSCRHTHPAVDAALDVHQQLNGECIDSIEIETYQAALNVCDRVNPSSIYEAKFSLQHTVAVALTNGKVEFDSFEEEQRQALSNLRSKVTLHVVEPYRSAYPNAWGAKVRTKTASNRLIECDRSGARGDPEYPLSREQMIEKAHMLLSFAGCSSDESRDIVEGILRLNSKQNCNKLVDHLVNNILR